MSSTETAAPGTVRWTFLSNHAHVLLCLANDPAVRQRDVATRVGITERSVGIIVADLVSEGYVVKRRVGRRNEYQVNPEQSLRHPLESHRSIGDLLELLRVDQEAG